MKKLIALIIALCIMLCSCEGVLPQETAQVLSDIPEYSGSAYVEIADNIPFFTESEKSETRSFEDYSRLDRLGRCGAAYANVGKDLMPTEKRGDIYSVKPTGWAQNTYAFIENGSLYNRCHLIAYMLTGENANERNLITGTRYMNTKGMLPFETKVCDYVRSTGNHVLYRVTPIFEGDNLLADGVEMEAWSVEDNGRGVCFNVYCYNVQPGVTITYANGKNKANGSIKVTGKSKTTGKTASQKYILNLKSKKFHLKSCSGASDISPENKKTYTGNRSDLIKMGYSPCGHCDP